MVGQLTVIGRVGRVNLADVNGTPVLNVRLAQDRSYVRDGQKVERTKWWSVSVYSKSAEKLAEYIKVGETHMFTGEPDAAIWHDREGNPQIDHRLSVAARGVTLLPNRAPRSQSEQETSTPETRSSRASSKASGSKAAPRKGKSVQPEDVEALGFEDDGIPLL